MMLQKSKLYYVNGSIPSMRVLCILNEKNIDYDKIRLKVMSDPKETRIEPFISINPKGKTPTLIDIDGTKVIESLAILQYIDTYYNCKLMPSANDKQSYKKVFERINESESLLVAYESVELIYKNENGKYDELIKSAYEDVYKELLFWEKYASENKYIAGPLMTLADFAFYPVLAYMIHRGVDLTNYPNLLKYYETMYERPACQNAHPFGWNKTQGGMNLFKIAEKLNFHKFNQIFNINKLL